MGDVQRIATIDIGTNSVLLTIAEKEEDGSLTTLAEEARITRIGEGLGTSQNFIPAAMERTAKVLQSYVGICRELKTDHIIAVGTAAFRRAVNAEDFSREMKQRFGLQIETISGEREADLSYLASQNFGEDLLVVDIGGGSTEFIRCDEMENIVGISLPLGCVVLHESLVKSDPLSDSDFAQLQSYIINELQALQGRNGGREENAVPPSVPKRLVALAGTATTLAAMHLKLEQYSHSDVHGAELNEKDVADFVTQLRNKTIEERKKIPGIESARADVILEGTLILHETMKLFGYETVTISDRGVRWGLIYEEFSCLIS